MRTLALGLALVLTAVAAPAHAGKKFSNDGVHTILGFRASTTLFDVDGRFDSYNLRIDGDPEAFDKAQVRLEIDAKSVDTGNKTRDNHLRSEDFFDVKKFPKIVFQSEKVHVEGDKLVIDGNLEIHGVKKPVSITFSKVVAKNGAGLMTHAFKAELPLNRNDFGVGTSSIAAKISLQDTVVLKLIVVGQFE